MNQDHGFDSGVFGSGLSAYSSWADITFQTPRYPSAHVGARLVICCVMLVWGLVSASNAFMRNAHGFYLLRFLLDWLKASSPPE